MDLVLNFSSMSVLPPYESKAGIRICGAGVDRSKIVKAVCSRGKDDGRQGFGSYSWYLSIF